MAAIFRRSLVNPNSRIRCLRCYSSKAPVRVRFAPSPTGQIHLGGLRTALYNYLFAKSHNGKFVLRIEDTDRTRYVPGASEKIIEMLEWSGLVPDEGPLQGGNYGPYYQSERLEIYHKNVETLLDSGHAYRCFCSEKRLDLIRRDAIRCGAIPKYDNKCRHLNDSEIESKMETNLPFTVRFKLESMDKPWYDIIHGPVHQNVAMIEGDPIILKSDGYPTYHLACVVDDHVMDISHVLRGVEWMASTSKHVLLHQAFGWTPPQFAHLPLLLNSDGTKLSKRQGDIGVESLKLRGYYPDAVLNLLTKAGSGFMNKDTVGMELSDLVKNFRLERLSPSSGRLQIEHLDSINRLHLKKRLLNHESESAEKLARLVGQGGSHYSQMSPDEKIKFVERALEWGQGRINKVEDFLDPDFRFLWFAPDVDSDWLETLPVDQSQVLLQTMKCLENLDDFQLPIMAPKLKSLVKEHGYKMADFMRVLRMSLCGLRQGPPVAEVMTLLNKTEVFKRLKTCHQIVSKS